MLIKVLFCLLLCFGLMGLNGVARAQVFKSYDEAGNVVFSDIPTQGSKEVKVNKPNLSDSLEVPPPVEPPIETESDAEPESEVTTQPIEATESADTNNDGRISRREKEAERKARRQKKREAAKAAAEEEN